MAGNLKVVEKKQSKRLERLKKEADNLSGFDKALLEDLLIEYDALAAMTEELRHKVEKHGVMIVKEVGSVNNRHDETVENPEFTTYQKAIGRMGDLAKKVSDFAKRSDVNEEEDELGSFIRR